MIIDTKRCTFCNAEKPRSEFAKKKDSKDGLRHWCHPCRRAQARDYFHNKCKTHPSFRVRQRGWMFRTKYGIGIENYNSLLEKQYGACAICGNPPTSEIGHGRLHVDHDHFTNRVRGLLCSGCNRGIGAFKDNPSFLVNAIEYLAL